MSRRKVLAATAAVAAVSPVNLADAYAPASGSPDAETPPNILLFTVDDMAGDTPGCFGGRPDVTPTLDRLADEGLLFRQAHVPIAVCQPSRSSLMTGLYPHHSGAEGFGPIREDVTVLNDVLRPRGYFTGILGKVTHLTPIEKYRWDLAVDQPDLGMGRDPARYAQEARAFFARAKAQHRPFFLMANSHDPHRPFHGSQQEHEPSYGWDPEQLATVPEPSKVFTPDDVEVPGFLPDLPDVRTELAQYLSSCRRADDTLASVLAELEKAGLASNTVVIFLSDNGMALPFAKTNCYLQSTQTPLIVRWPGTTSPGFADSHHFVSTLDLFPTLCRAAGVDAPRGLDGVELTPLLQGRDQPGRDRVHTVFHVTAQSKRYETRATEDSRWGYIWNAWSDGETAFRNESMTGLTWPAMTAAAETDPAVAERVDFFLHRVPEELYDLENDPDSLHNLAPAPGEPANEAVQAALERERAAMYTWMQQTRDPLRDQYRHTVLAGAAPR